MKFLLGLLFLYLFPVLALADNSQITEMFTPVPTDLSVQYLSNIFGVVDGVLHSTGGQMMGVIFGKFNAALLVLGSGIMMYITAVGTLKSAHEGEILGKQWSKWVPIRLVLGFGMLIPKASGYCFIQIFVMWIVVQGIGAADTVWGAAAQYLYQGGSLVSPSTNLQSQNQPLVGLAGNVLKMETCMFVASNALNDYANDPSNISSNIIVPSFAGSLALVGAHTLATPPCYYDATLGANGNYPTRCQQNGTPYYDTAVLMNFPGDTNVVESGSSPTNYKANCGTLQWNIALKNPSSTTDYTPDMGAQMDSRTGAMQLLVTELQPIAQSLANTIIPSNLTSMASYTPVTSDQLNTWANAHANNLIQTAIDYWAITGPYQSQAHQTTVNSDIQQVYQSSQQDGWIVAGSWYAKFAHATANSSANEDMATITQTFTYGNGSNSSFDTDFWKSSALSDIPSLLSSLNYNATNKTVNPIGMTDTASYPSKYGSSPYSPPNAIDNYINTDYNNFITFLNINFGSGYASGSSGGGNSSSTIIAPANAANIAWLAPLAYVAPVHVGLIAAMAGEMVYDINQLSNNNVDPILQISQMGIHIVIWAQTLWIVGSASMFILALAASPGACVNPFPYAITVGSMFFIPMLTALMLGLIASGAMMAYYVPLIPFIIFLFTTIGWFVSVIEAMCAAPLVALGIAHPEGQHEILGRAEPALMLLTSVFMRPTLIIIGFLAGTVLVRVALWLFNQGFSNITQETTGGIIALAAIMIIYVWVVMEIIERCFALIHEVPTQVLQWIGGSPRGFGEAEAVRGVKAGVQGGMGAMAAPMQAGEKGAESAGEGSETIKAKGKGGGGSIKGAGGGGDVGGANP